MAAEEELHALSAKRRRQPDQGGIPISPDEIGPSEKQRQRRQRQRDLHLVANEKRQKLRFLWAFLVFLACQASAPFCKTVVQSRK